MRLSTLLKLFAVATVGLSVALIAVVKSIDFNQYKGFLAAQVRGATGRDLTISGPLDLKLGMVPSVVASGITFSNMPTGSRPEMARAERIEAEVALIPLLARRVEVRKLVLINTDLLLETDIKGRPNWVFAPAGGMTEQSAQPETGAPPTRLDAGDVSIRNARITVRTGLTGKTTRLTFDKLDLKPGTGAGGLVGLSFAGSYDGTPFAADGGIGSLADLGSGEPWPVKMKGTLDGAALAVDGTLVDPLAGTGLDMKVTAQGEELAALLRVLDLGPAYGTPALGPYKAQGRLTDASGILAATEIDAAFGRRDTALLSAKGSIKNLLEGNGIELAVTAESDDLAGLSATAGSDLPSMGPLTVAAHVTDGKQGWTFSELKAALGASDLAGELTLATSGRPRLTGTLTATTLTVADFTTPATKPGETLTPKPADVAVDGRLFPAESLPVEVLRALDADVRLSVGTLVFDKATLRDVTTTIRIDKGRLTIAPFAAGLGGGKLEGSMILDASGGGSEMTAALNLTATDVELGRVVRKAGAADMVTGGQSNARIAVQGRGDSIRAIMATLNGDVRLQVGEGRIQNSAVDWGGDTLFRVLGSLNPVRSEETTLLHCGALRFSVKNGLARADRGIAVETEKVNVVGAGTVDLRTEALDIGITPSSSDGLGLSLGGAIAEMTRVRGTLANPSVGIDELGTARAAASVGAAVATGGISLLGEILFDKVTKDRSPCRTALGKGGSRG